MARTLGYLFINFSKANKQQQNWKPWMAQGRTYAPFLGDRSLAGGKSCLLVNLGLLNFVPLMLYSVGSFS